MNYWKVILATVVIFGAGVLTGGLLVDITQRDLFATLLHRSSGTNTANHQVAVATPSTNSTMDGHTLEVNAAHSSDFVNHRLGLIQKMDTVLRLTPEQHDVISKIIAGGQGQINKVMQDTFQSVKDQLTPEQQTKYVEMLKQFRVQPHATSSTITTNRYLMPMRQSVTLETNSSAI